MDDPKKWACEYCTYENWPAAKKCTLCRAPRPLQLIQNEVELNEQDIYKIAPLICPPTDTSILSSANNNVAGTCSPGASGFGKRRTKWACHVCTYLNWARAQKCTQCLTSRLRSSPVSPSSSELSLNKLTDFKPLSVNVNITEHKPAAKYARNSPRISPNSPEMNKEINNDRNRAVAAGNVKWICRSCTYENWFKACKCSICGTIRLDPGSPNNANLPAQAPVITEFISNANRPSTPRQLPSPRASLSNETIEGAAAPPPLALAKTNSRAKLDSRLNQIKNRMLTSDWLWLNACVGIVEGDPHALEAYIVAGGDPTRLVTENEALLLNRPSAFTSGQSLVHLAIRFKREDMLAVLLSSSDVAQASKRVPSHISPDIASEILREISSSVRQRKGDLPCYFLTDVVTFSLPAELESDEAIINWNMEVTGRLGSRLYSLWNRTAGDCLLDSVLQSTWGVFDRDNMLRRALADSLNEGACSFYPRWKEYESVQAESLHFSLEENQWQHDWSILLSLASQQGAALEQTHIFALAHILRRPIIVYGVKFIKSFRGETLGYAGFQGVYLPLLWEQSFCWKTPISLGYTRGHFSALVPMETDTDENIGAGANVDNSDHPQIVYLPLMDSEGKILPIHFVVGSEVGKEESILREWLDCCVTEGGLLVAQVRIGKRPTLVKHMLDEWLDRYRRLGHVIQSPVKTSSQLGDLSTDEETDDE